MKLSNSSPAEPPRALVGALRRLLKPLVRLLLAHGLTLPFLVNLLKATYVAVAEQEFPVAGKPQTDSRISLITGVHRKDVRRLRNADLADGDVPESTSIGIQVVSRWVGDRRYLDRSGAPRALRLRADGARGPNFEELVDSVSRGDIRARVVLDELLRLGIAVVEDHGGGRGDRRHVHLNVDAFVPEQGFEEKAYYFGEILHDHISAGVHNLMGQRPPYLDRTVIYHQLSPAQAARLAEHAADLGMEALKSVNRKALAMKRRRHSPAEQSVRINFGTYFYTENDAGEDLDDQSDHRHPDKGR